MKSPSSSLQLLWSVYKSTPLETDEIPQSELNLDSSRNTNPLRYRGQFSPDLAGRLIGEYTSEKDVLYDPFLGCGTTIYEGIARNLESYGTEINTAGVEMARLAEFVSVPKEKRESICSEAVSIANQLADPNQSKLGGNSVQYAHQGELKKRVVASIQESEFSDLVRSLLVNGLMEWDYTSGEKSDSFPEDVKIFSEFVKELPYTTSNTLGIFHRDCRFVPLPSNSIDFVLTSPPYINVHNYHQHHRDSIEEFGWDILQMAKSEFGSNRKNRQNRFKTVVQFAIDTAQVFSELRRVLHNSGRMIFVVGRTSTVRGVQFNNGQFITAIGILSGFDLDTRQERVYQNNFGEEIYEDILHFTKDAEQTQPQSSITPEEFGREVLRHKLEEEPIQEDVRSDIESAMTSASPQPSPVLYGPTKQK